MAAAGLVVSAHPAAAKAPLLKTQAPGLLSLQRRQHAHIDHIGGIQAADGSRNFPNAQIFIAQADLEYWTNEGLAGTSTYRLRKTRGTRPA